MELDQVMRTTGAAREFTGAPIAPGVLYRVLDNARFAPSGGNQQGWHVTVVRDRAARERIAELCEATWQRYLAEQATGHRGFSITDPAPADIDVPSDLPPHPTFANVDRVGELLVISVDLGVLAALDRDLDRFPLVSGASIYPFVHNILLAARNEGLGGVLTTFAAASEPELAPLLGLPDQHAIAAAVALGTPVHQVTKLSRNPVESFTTIDRYDGPALAP